MNLRTIRKDAGLSVPELSRRSGVPIRTIENIERNNNATVVVAIKLADALGVTLDELCRDTPDKTE
ncbi:MAG: helix-turn-helix transcriptional regulator [Oscillospiraceae bacterium]|nr:helix-turn-helix transcriptional regulator [Oscillospiraceae bacterium]